MMALSPLYLSAQLALATTLTLMVLAPPLAYGLVFARFPGKSLLGALLNLPLVLPPTVLGFYLLLLMGPKGLVGRLWEAAIGAPLIFTFTAILLASLLYNLPFALQPLKAAFEKLDPRLLESAYVLGLSRRAAFFQVMLPNALNGLVAAAVLVFIHTMGEFGVILMVGGSIPGKTKVASIAIYEAVEALNYREAGLICLALVPLSYAVLLLLNRLTRS
jgi:molybdate transport system permease protein